MRLPGSAIYVGNQAAVLVQQYDASLLTDVYEDLQRNWIVVSASQYRGSGAYVAGYNDLVLASQAASDAFAAGTISTCGYNDWLHSIRQQQRYLVHSTGAKLYAAHYTFDVYRILDSTNHYALAERAARTLVHSSRR
jgi:hypothetical protein